MHQKKHDSVAQLVEQLTLNQWVESSRTQGLFLYSGLKSGHPFTAVGATVESVFTKKNWETEDGEKIPLLDAVAAQECGKVYISGGTTRTVTKADNQPEPVQQEEEDAPFSVFA